MEYLSERHNISQYWYKIHRKHHNIVDISFILSYFKYSVLGISCWSGNTARRFQAIPVSTVPTSRIVDNFTSVSCSMVSNCPLCEWNINYFAHRCLYKGYCLFWQKWLKILTTDGNSNHRIFKQMKFHIKFWSCIYISGIIRFLVEQSFKWLVEKSEQICEKIFLNLWSSLEMVLWMLHIQENHKIPSFSKIFDNFWKKLSLPL